MINQRYSDKIKVIYSNEGQIRQEFTERMVARVTTLLNT
jgi:hypothetical protein